jgi:type I restriction enzyme M protein
MNKPKKRKGKIIFINGVNEVRLERSDAWLEDKHIKKMADAYWKFKDIENFAKVMSNEEALKNNGNLSLQLYVKQANSNNEYNTVDLIAEITTGQKQLNKSLKNLFSNLKDIGIEI